MKKRILCAFISFVILILNFSSCFVSAEMTQVKFDYLKSLFKFYGGGDVLGLKYPKELVDGVWSAMENKLKESGELDENGNVVHEYGGGNGRYFGDDENGNLIVKEEFMNDFTVELQDKIKALNGYYLFDNFTPFEYDFALRHPGNGASVASFFDCMYQKARELYFSQDLSGSSIFNSVPEPDFVVAWVPSYGNWMKEVDFGFIYDKYGYYMTSSSTWNKGPYSLYDCYVEVTFPGDYVDSEDDLTIKFSHPAMSYDFNKPIAVLGSPKPIKIFYSKNDYNLYVKAVQGGQEPTNIYYYSPTYNGGDIVINRQVYNNYVDGRITDQDITNWYNTSVHKVENDNGITVEGATPSQMQEIVDKAFEDFLQKLSQDSGGVEPTPSPDPEPSPSPDPSETPDPSPSPSPGPVEPDTGGGNEPPDYTDILQKILDSLRETDGRVDELYELFKEFSGKEGCQYDFEELKTYLDTVYLENHQDLVELQHKVEQNGIYQQQMVERLDNIYERLGGFSDYTDILNQIYAAISGGEYSLDDLVRAIDSFAAANDADLDEILVAIQTSNDYFDALLSRLPASFASFDDSSILDRLDDIIDELVINNDYNEKILNQLRKMYDLMVREAILDHIRDKAKQCADKASEVFPTSVPWDMARLVNALAAEPETPVFRVPINISSIGVEEEIVIDLHDFDSYAGKFRTVMVVLFAAGLMGLTITFFKDKF